MSDDVARRATAAGRAGIAALVAHPASGVRVLAAAHSLDGGAPEPVAALERLARGDGLHAIAARHALGELRAGRLQLDGDGP